MIFEVIVYNKDTKDQARVIQAAPDAAAAVAAAIAGAEKYFGVPMRWLSICNDPRMILPAVRTN